MGPATRRCTLLSAAFGQLGQGGAAAQAVGELIRVRPDVAAQGRRDMEKWWEPEQVQRLIEGWRKAALNMVAAQAPVPRP